MCAGKQVRTHVSRQTQKRESLIVASRIRLWLASRWGYLGSASFKSALDYATAAFTEVGPLVIKLIASG